MHDYYDHRLRVSHPTSIELYKLSNHTHIPQMQKNILVYVFAGLVGICISIKCMQLLLGIFCKTCESRESNNMLITNRVVIDEDSSEVSESYEPPEELHQSQRDERYRPNQTNRSNSIEPTLEENEESENSEDLPSYYEVCVKTNQ
jgi:hypothetical protein